MKQVLFIISILALMFISCGDRKEEKKAELKFITLDEWYKKELDRLKYLDTSIWKIEVKRLSDLYDTLKARGWNRIGVTRSILGTPEYGSDSSKIGTTQSKQIKK